MESEREKQACGCHGHQKSCDAAADGEQDAFGESLRNNLAARGTEGEADGGLSAARDRACEKKVRDIGAGDQQHQAANRKKDLKAAAILFFHYGDARARGNNVDGLLGKHADYVGHPVGRIAGIILHPLAQYAGEARRHSVDGCAGTHAADHAQPCGDRLVE